MKDRRVTSQKKHIPTTMTVNWTPFLALFPLRLPAKDMVTVSCEWVKGEVRVGLEKVKKLVLMRIIWYLKLRLSPFLGGVTSKLWRQLVPHRAALTTIFSLPLTLRRHKNLHGASSIHSQAGKIRGIYIAYIPVSHLSLYASRPC